MKKFTTYLSIATIPAIFLVSCTKSFDFDYTINQSGGGSSSFSSISKALTIKVFEYGSHINLSNAKFTMIGFPSTYSTGEIYGTWYTDSVGEIHLRANELPIPSKPSLFQVNKDNYWKNGGTNQSFLDYFEPDTIISSTNQDSIVVSLFPYSWIKVHLRNKNTYDSTTNITLSCLVLKYPNYNIVSLNSSNFEITLSKANHIDTTFIISTKGNVNNQLVVNSASSSPIPLFNETRLINKGDTLKWEVQY